MYACTCVRVPVCAHRGPQEPGDAIDSPGSGVTGRDEDHTWVQGSEPQPLEQQFALLSTEPYLLSPNGNNFEIGKRHSSNLCLKRNINMACPREMSTMAAWTVSHGNTSI